MDKRKWLAPVLILACLFAQPVALQAQCVASSPMAMTPGAGTMSVTIMFPMAMFNSVGMCVVGTMVMDVLFCGLSPAAGGPPLTPVLLLASAATPHPPGMPPVCSWVCTCPPGMPQTFVVGTSTGLPVELMDFEIEDDVDGVEVEDDVGEEARQEAVEAPRAAAPR